MEFNINIKISKEIVEWAGKIEHFWCNCMCLDQERKYCDMSCQLAFFTLAKKSCSKFIKGLEDYKNA